MSTDVVMPQMGESIAEGTVVRWMKKVGDHVDRDEPLFEISTDKVDAEIPSPAEGVLAEIRVKEGETVPVHSVVAVIGVVAVAGSAGGATTNPVDASAAGADGQARGVARAHGSAGHTIRERSSPLVRRIAKEHQVDIAQLHGTGIAGRVTKDDILGYLGETGRPGRTETPPAPISTPAWTPGETDRVEKMTVMRKRIAEHMVLSRRTSAHVHSVFEVNFARLARIREATRAEYERAGAKLTYLSFIIKAAVGALRAVPIVNASVDGDSLVFHKDVNIGVAVALDWGLIVPVVKHADQKDLLALSLAVADLAGRARSKQLTPDEVAGGTFTITNPGALGALFGMPIINQPQLAILGVGNVEKRPVVIDDAIAIRPMAYLTLGYDHRVIDGAVADTFMAHLKESIENWDTDQV
jgi:2-oxoglutarate dehydrogenase E2 component (dihydrolipoamide succinyltransferase)